MSSKDQQLTLDRIGRGSLHLESKLQFPFNLQARNSGLTDKAFLLKARLGFIKTSHFKLAKLRIFKAIYSRKIKVRELQPNC